MTPLRKTLLAVFAASALLTTGCLQRNISIELERLARFEAEVFTKLLLKDKGVDFAQTHLAKTMAHFHNTIAAMNTQQTVIHYRNDMRIQIGAETLALQYLENILAAIAAEQDQNALK